MHSRPISPAILSLSVVTDEKACREIWRNATARFDDLSPFLQPLFQEGLERIVPWTRVLLNAPQAGLASVFIRSRGPIKDLVLAPFSPFSAVLPIDEGTKVNWGRFLQPTKGCPPTRLLSVPPGVPREDFDRVESAEIGTRFTYHLPTAPLEEAIQAWSASQRRTHRKHCDDYTFSVLEPASVTAADTHIILKELVELTRAGYARHGRRLPLDPAGLSTWAANLLGGGLGRLFTLRNASNGALEAGVLALHHSSMAWYWLAGSTPGPAMTVLMAHVQDALHAADIPVLDLMGANTPGISEFKRRFGGKKVAYLHIRTSSFAGRWADGIARGVRRFFP